jgi:hypothetical protein
MRIRMLSTQRGADDGVTVRSYEAGQEYEIGGSPRAEDLAAVFLREGWAVEVKSPPVVEEKASAAPENKAVSAAPENKGRKR